MKRLATIAVVVLLAASFANAAGERAWLEKQLKAWEGGEPPPGFKSPNDSKQLIDYEIINVVYTRLNGVDTALFNCMLGLPGPGGKPTPWRAVIRVGPDPKGRAEYRVGIGWRRFDSSPHEPRPASATTPPAALTAPQKEAAAKCITQLRNEKNDPDPLREQLVGMGLAVLPMLQKDLHTGDMRIRLKFCGIVDSLNPPDEAKILADELPYAVSSFMRLVSGIRDNAQQAADYRARAAKLPDVTGAGGSGGLKYPGEKTDKESYLRLAAKLDEKVADGKRELDACGEVVETLCNYFAQTGADSDVPLFVALACDKGMLSRVPGWSLAVIADDEYAQLPPVGFSVHSSVNVALQEQDWLPWGPVWGTLRTLVTTRARRASLIDCRDALEKAYVPVEKKKTGPWQQMCAVTEFQRTEALLIEQLGSDHGTPVPPAPVECVGDARAKLLATIYGPGAPAKTEDEWDKRRRLGREAEARRSAELVTWRVAMKYVPGPAAGAMDAAAAKAEVQIVVDPCFMTGDFDNFKETLPVTAFLGMREGAGGTVERILLGTFDVPLKAAVAFDIEKGKRHVSLELWCRLKVRAKTKGTLGAVCNVSVPVEVTRMALHDDATGEVLYDKTELPPKEEPAATESPKAPPAPAPKNDDKDVIKEVE